MFVQGKNWLQLSESGSSSKGINGCLSCWGEHSSRLLASHVHSHQYRRHLLGATSSWEAVLDLTTLLATCWLGAAQRRRTCRWLWPPCSCCPAWAGGQSWAAAKQICDHLWAGADSALHSGAGVRGWRGRGRETSGWEDCSDAQTGSTELYWGLEMFWQPEEEKMQD